MHDYWPRSLDNRLEAVEGIQSKVLLHGINLRALTDITALWETEEVYPPCDPNVLTYATKSNPYPSSTAFSFNHMFFKNDGLKVYLCNRANGGLGQGLAEYDLSTAWDASSITNNGSNITYTNYWQDNGGYGGAPGAGAAGFPSGVFFDTTGTKCFLVDNYVNGPSSPVTGIARYDLSTPWDISTMSHTPTQTYNASSLTSTSIVGIAFSRDGKEMYLGNNDLGAWIYQVSLAKAWDLSSATGTTSKSFTGLPNYTNTRFQEVFIDQSGTYIFAMSESVSAIRKLNLTTAFDVSSGSYDETVNFPNDVTGSAQATWVSDDCENLMVLTTTTDKRIWQNTTG